MATPASEKKPITADTFLRGLWQENPTFVMVLGLCPSLAVTNTTKNALGMGLATIFVLLGSSALVSMMRNVIQKQVRIASYIVIIAAFVTVVDYTVHALDLELYNALGAFLQLIVVNCIILGRAESYASKHRVTKSVVNALGIGVGFSFALLCMGSVREILGAGTLLGFPLFGTHFQPWVVMVLPPGGFFVIGGWLLLFAWLKERKARKTVVGAPAHATR